jgi:hypothetical protein
MHREVHALRLEEQLREEHGSSYLRFATLAETGVRLLLRAAHLAG